MKIQSFSIISGSAACNAACPFCVSKMTGINKIGYQEPVVNWHNFHKAAALAKDNQISTVLITGKGEPLLFPDMISGYLAKLSEYHFPIIELQTNGLILAESSPYLNNLLVAWHNLGLSFISISIISDDPEINRQNYCPGRKEYPDLTKIINLLHKIGFSVRLSVVLTKGVLDNPQAVSKLLSFTKPLAIEQISLRPVAASSDAENTLVLENTKKLLLERTQIDQIRKYLEENGHTLVTYGHGSVIYDLAGQNVCLTNALTLQPNSDDIRQMIFFPDGRIKFDWQYQGATIL